MRWRLALVLLSVALLGLTFPPVGAAPLAFLAPVPLLLALRGVSARGGLGIGFLWGFLAGAATAWWFVPVFEGKVHFAALLWAVMAVFPAIFGLGHAVAEKRGPVALAVFAPALWIAVDWLKSEGTWLRFAWFTLGHGLAGDSRLRQNADLAGVYGLTLVAFVTAFLLARALSYRDGRRVVLAIVACALPLVCYARGNRVLGFAPPLPQTTAAIGSPVRPFGLAVPMVRPDEVTIRPRELGRPLRVLAVQDENFDRSEPKRRLTEAAIARDGRPDAILWPEVSFFFDWETKPEVRRSLREVAALASGAFIFGSMRRAPQGEWNAAMVLAPDGSTAGEYHKRVPVQFVEGSIPGEDAPTFDVSGTRVGLLICYDGTYPFVTRDLVWAGAEAILTPSMDMASWPKVQHEDHALFYPLRACEVRRPIVRAASSGVSVALDAWGRELARLDAFETGTFTAAIHPQRELTPYVRAGWLLPFVALGVVAAGALAAIAASIRRKS